MSGSRSASALEAKSGYFRQQAPQPMQPFTIFSPFPECRIGVHPRRWNSATAQFISALAPLDSRETRESGSHCNRLLLLAWRRAFSPDIEQVRAHGRVRQAASPAQKSEEEVQEELRRLRASADAFPIRARLGLEEVEVEQAEVPAVEFVHPGSAEQPSETGQAHDGPVVHGGARRVKKPRQPIVEAREVRDADHQDTARLEEFHVPRDDLGGIVEMLDESARYDDVERLAEARAEILAEEIGAQDVVRVDPFAREERPVLEDSHFRVIHAIRIIAEPAMERDQVLAGRAADLQHFEPRRQGKKRRVDVLPKHPVRIAVDGAGIARTAEAGQ